MTDVFIWIGIILYVYNRMLKHYLPIIECFLFLIYFFEIRQNMLNISQIYELLISSYVILYCFLEISWQIKYMRKIYHKYEHFKEMLKYRVTNMLGRIFNLILFGVLSALVYVQVSLKLGYINLLKRTTIELLGFSISIVSIYGIYVAFLQFLSENDKNYYLGISRTRFILNRAWITQIIKTKVFYCLLGICVIFPIVRKLLFKVDFNIPSVNVFLEEKYIYNIKNFLDSIINQNYIEYIWQTSCLILIIIYIYLLKLSFGIIYTMFKLNDEQIRRRKKSKNDGIDKWWRLNDPINSFINREFSYLFWKIYKNKDNYQTDWIGDYLENKFIFLETADVDEFVYNLFNDIYWGKYNFSKRIRDYIDSLNNFNSKKTVKFYEFYKSFCINKWEILKRYEEHISPDTWYKLISQDLMAFDELIKNDKTFECLYIEYPKETDRFFDFYKNDTFINEYLFKILINKKDISFDKIIADIKQDLRSMQYNLRKREEQYKEYYEKFMSYRLNQLFKVYESGSTTFNLPKFYGGFIKDSINDLEHFKFYSKVCFDYLIHQYGRPNFEQDTKVREIILSMNEEYQLAYMLYQLMYTDYVQFDGNIAFYDVHIPKIIKDNSKNIDDMFENVKKIISNTDIGHRITNEFLTNIWNTKTDVIKNFDWFKKFGSRHQMSNFKIVYVQHLLNVDNDDSRFQLEQDIEDIDNVYNFCWEYLKCTERLPSIFEKNRIYGYTEKKELQLTVEYLFKSDVNVIKKMIYNDITLKFLLKLEILLYNNYIFDKENTLDKILLNIIVSEPHILYNPGLMDFCVLNFVNYYYVDMYKDTKIKNVLKNFLTDRLRRLNKTLEEYISFITEEATSLKKIADIDKNLIITEIDSLLLSNEKQITGTSSRKYKYKKR